MFHHASDSPYPTTNAPPLTTHLALNVCGALHRQCPCDDDRYGKEDDCAPDVVSRQTNLAGNSDEKRRY